MKKFLHFSLSDVVFIMLMNIKMPTIVGILIFMSKLNFVLSLVEYEKSLITSGPAKTNHRNIFLYTLKHGHSVNMIDLCILLYVIERFMVSP